MNPIFQIAADFADTQQQRQIQMDLRQYAISLADRHFVLARRLVESGRVPLRAWIAADQREWPAFFVAIRAHYDEMFDYLLGKGHEEPNITQVRADSEFLGF